MSTSILLVIDAVINLVLGAILVAFPAGLVSALGLPVTRPAFYPSILGAVLIGIGVALVVERVRGSSGLGLLGAITINLIGALVLAIWLLSGSLALPSRGRVLLWALVVVLGGISALELVSHGRGAAERAS